MKDRSLLVMKTLWHIRIISFISTKRPLAIMTAGYGACLLQQNVAENASVQITQVPATTVQHNPASFLEEFVANSKSFAQVRPKLR